mgnify:FL=1
MDGNKAVFAVLGDLLSAEQRSLLLRLPECSPFVGGLGESRLRDLRRAARENTEHVAWLTEAIVERGGTPVAAVADPRTASLHYASLDYLLSRIAPDERRLLAACESALENDIDRAACDLIRRIAARHREHLAVLGE